VHADIDELDAAQWNALGRDDQPFLSHEFLSALARHGAVGGRSGWHPRYLAARHDGRLVGAVPLYLKDHSFGEFVFDWAWAGAYERNGLRYYPKLVAAVPFTPVTGPRLLLSGGPLRDDTARRLIEGALGQVSATGASSLHWLFTAAPDAARLEAAGLMPRHGCQFHWENPGYDDFDQFLGALSSRHRKKIRAERRSVEALHGLAVEALAGDRMPERALGAFHRFYVSTFIRKGNRPPLTLGFLRDVAARLGDRTLFIMAREGDEYVAGALFFVGRDTLYGRNWGADDHYRNLHFELCYYRAMQYCIDRGLRRFEAGAQGEYKVQRGFAPARTCSAHWLADERFAAAVASFLAEERGAIEDYMADMRTHLPFKGAP
jgi:predicted N-acyltransferase